MNTQHVTVTQQRVNILAVRFALEHLRRLRKAHADYEEEVREWYSRGDGRSPKWHTFVEGDNVWQENVGGKGYAFPACIHGTSRWTDYDNICGPCEDSLTLHQEALLLGHRDAHEFHTRLAVVRQADEARVPRHIYTQLVEWASEPADKITKPTPRRLP